MIHATAVIGPQVKLGERVAIGPYAVLAGQLEIGDDCRIGPHVHLSGRTKIGARCRIHAGAVVGDEPQDHNWEGGESGVRIGDDCTIREYVTIHRGTAAGSDTVVGNHVMLMGFVHLAHNCQVRDHAVLANATMLAGYVEVGTGAFVSGGVMVHQFVRIGRLAMITADARIGKDVPPFCMVGGSEALIYGPNRVGLRRAGMDAATRGAIKDCLKLYFFSGLNQQAALDAIETQHGACPEAREFANFIVGGRRGILRGIRNPGEEE